MIPFSRRAAVTISVVALATIIAACGEDAVDTTTTTTTDVSSTSSTVAPSTTATTRTPPPTIATAQDAIDWFVGLLNGDDLTAETYEATFSEDFRQEVPFDEGITVVLDELRASGPYTVTARDGEGLAGTANVGSAGDVQYEVVAEVDAAGLISALLIRPSTETQDAPATLDEAYQRLDGIGTLGMVSAEIVDETCVPISGAMVDSPVPLGSVFKLYVLAAVAEAVAAGEIAWSDEIPIQEEMKSIPPGAFASLPDGTTVTVRKATNDMISLSDNTATDLLMNLVGREDIEATMIEYGNSNPELNLPFPTTREFAALKVGPASGLRIQWVNGDEQARRSILEQISDITVDDIPVQEWTEPIDPDLVEWFATPNDLCELAIDLYDLADRVPEIAEILSVAGSTDALPGPWESLWFKGGSEPGLAAAWFVTSADGRVFVTAGSVVDPEAVIDTNAALALFAEARDLLAP